MYVSLQMVNNILITSNDNTVVLWDLQKDKKTGSLTGFLNDRDQGGLAYDMIVIGMPGWPSIFGFKNYLLISKEGKELIKGKFGTKVKRWGHRIRQNADGIYRT